MTEMISRTLMSNKELRLAVDRRFGNPNNASRCDTASSGYDVSSLQAQIDSVMDEIRKKVTAEQIVRQRFLSQFKLLDFLYMCHFQMRYFISNLEYL